MRSALSILLLAATAQAQVTASHIPFNLTAISSKNGYSVLECWQLSTIPVDAMQAANYAVGNTTVATWSKIEPRTHIGEAWAPHVQWVSPQLVSFAEHTLTDIQTLGNPEWSHQNHVPST